DANDEREFLRDFAGTLSPADYWARTDHILYDEQTTAANRIMVRLDDDHARLARARIGLISGAGNVDALIRDVPQALQGDAGLLYDRVRWRRQRDNGDGVFDLVPQFGEPGARPDLWWRQRFNLVREALSKGHISQAYTIAKNHGMTEPAAVAEAEWLAG